MTKAKYDVESAAKDEELEEMRRKFSAKLAEADDQVEQAVAKVQSLDKQKGRLGAEVEELVAEVERANSSVNSMEKKQKQFDRLVAEWRGKCESLTGELEGAQKEARNAAGDIFRWAFLFNTWIDKHMLRWVVSKNFKHVKMFEII
jgi:myosin protein heavy chain